MASALRVALVTEPAVPDLRPDDRGLPAAFARHGAEAVPVPWGGAAAGFDLVVVRTPWDYFERAEAFLAWVEGLDAPVVNPPSVLRWNTHKGYLLELQRAGLARIPATRVLAPGERPARVEELLDQLATERAVLKPAISGGAAGTFVVEGEGPIPWERATAGTYLAQGFLDQIEEEGEWSLVHFGGELSHSLRKTAAKGDYRVQEEHGGAVHAEAAPASLVATAGEVLAGAVRMLGLDAPLAYARVDMVPVAYGPPLLMELELIEPELFFRTTRGAEDRFVAACLAAAGR